MNFQEIKKIISEITYKKGWIISCNEDKGGRPYVQISVTEETESCISSVTGQKEPWSSGKSYLSPFMCRQEIVGAVFGLIRAAEEHEMREWFRYKGASIFNPHLDPDALVEIAKYAKNFNMRQNAMSMKE